MGESFGIPFMLDAIRGALSAIGGLARTPDVDAVVLEAYALRELVEAWRDRLPTGEVREATMERVLRLHAQAVRCARTAQTGWVSHDERRAEGGASRRSSEIEEGERPTVPPPFDLEAFARRATAPESDMAPFPEGPPESGNVGVSPPPPSSSVRVAGRSSGPPPSSAPMPENAYLGHLGWLERIPVVAAPAEVMRLGIDHRAGFLMSLMDGCTPIEALLDLCAMPKPVAMQILVELVERGVVVLR